MATKADEYHMNKKTVLVSVNFLAEVEESELEKDNGELTKLEWELSEAHDKLTSKIEIDWESSQSIVLEPENMNCGKCSSCGRWTTDREAPEAIKQICFGARVEGKILCDECLPKEHRWAF